MQPSIAEERTALVDLLETLGPDDWAVPSLCSGWTVKDVVAHLTSALESGPLDFARAAVAGFGLPGRTVNRLAARWATRPPAELVAGLRARVDQTIPGPAVVQRAQLTDVMVHRLDIAVPLGLTVARPAESWLPTLQFLTSRVPVLDTFRGGRPRVTWQATDLSWTAGSGPVVSGPAEAIGLTLSGRSPWLDRLSGNGVPALREWLAP